ncbi:MAG: ComF family protein [Steroidobacteraceae bacterium]
MFERRAATVNLQTPAQSTIAGSAARLFRQAWRSVAAVLAPPVCSLCGAPGRWPGAHVALDLCEHCLAALPAVTSVASLSCGPVWALASYDYPADHMIRALKFHGERVYGRVLGTLLGERRAADPRALPQVVLPVPLHRQRFSERGFNQAAEIAQFAAQVLGLPMDQRLLLRPRATLEQSELAAAARHRNVRGAFEVTRSRVPAHIALVDDVLTTGSTLNEAARALQMAGVASIEVWVAARVAEVGDAWLKPESRSVLASVPQRELRR